MSPETEKASQSDSPEFFTDDTLERRAKSLWHRLLRVHLVMAFFGGLALFLIDPSLWLFFGVGIAIFSAYACVTLVLTRKGLMIPNVACGRCNALGFPSDLRLGEGRCQRCGSDTMWVKGKRKIIRRDGWEPPLGTEPPAKFKGALPVRGMEVLEGAIAVNDGFGAKAGGD